MRNIFTLKRITWTALSLVMTVSLSAQEFCTFQRLGSQDPTVQDIFPGQHRSRPVVGDFNNDGNLDIYYGGQNPDAGGHWNCLSNLIVNNGDGTYTPISNPVLQIKKDENGDPVLNEDGNPIWEAVPSDKENLIDINSRSYFRFFDYNNDGNLDIMMVGRKEWGLPDNDYTVLYKNLGPEKEYGFQQVIDPGFTFPASNEDNKEGISVGDYDKDGLLDIVILGWEDLGDDKSRRFVELYKNNGNDTFSLQEVATTQGGVLDGDGNPTNAFKPASNGSVLFADMNNDGWLDIVYTGYSDSSAEEIRIYQNMQDGTFNDVTPLDDIRGTFESQTRVVDLNADGLLDILLLGTGNNWATTALIFMNDGDFAFSPIDSDESGLTPVRGKPTAAVADLNHDGRLDIIYAGWSPVEGIGDKTFVYYQDAMGKFKLDDSYPIVHIEASTGGIVLADFNNDNALDVFIAGYNRSGGYGCQVRMFENKSDIAKANTPPTVPTNVKAAVDGGVLTITWDASTDETTSEEALVYNVYVKNNLTGVVSMILPADLTTGKLKIVDDLQTAVSGVVKKYTLKVEDIEEGYTVGVQAIDQGRLTSKFATKSTINTGVYNPNAAKVTVKSVKDGFVVTSTVEEVVVVTDMFGKIIKQAKTNEVIPVEVNGVYIISVAGNTLKMVK